MILRREQAELFYRAWWPLLAWVNERKRLVPAFPQPTPDRPLPVAIAQPIRSALWADDRIREQYLAERGPALAPDERELIASWKQRRNGNFVLFKHLRSHSIFMSDEVFGVVGLYSPIAELVPAVPAYVEAVLLPFGDRIVIDGILSSPGVHLMFGAGMRRAFARQYANARADSKIVTSLLPAAMTPRRPAVKRGTSAKAGSVIGTWRITQTEHWDREMLDLVELASIRFEADRFGALAMIALRADVDFRVDGARVDFSFVGEDDGAPCAGRGWAIVGDDDILRGRLYLHRGDDSAFEAERAHSSPRRADSRGPKVRAWRRRASRPS